MYSKYDEKNQQLSIEYNRSLEHGDYMKALECLCGLIEIAEAEERNNDRQTLLEAKVLILRHIHRLPDSKGVK